MKKLFLSIIGIAFAGLIMAQDLPDDVQPVFKAAERYKSKGELNQAVNAYKEVLRSVNHVPSMVGIATIEMDMRQPPNYRFAYEYYDMAINQLESMIAATAKKGEKKDMAEQRDELIPKRNKAKSHVDQFDNINEMHQGGSNLLDEE